MLLSQKYFFFYSRTVTKLHRVLHSGHTSFFFCNCFAFRVGSAAFRCFSGQQATGRRQVGGRHFRFVSYGQFLSSRFLPSTTIWNVSLAVRSTLDLRPIGLSVTTSMGRIFFWLSRRMRLQPKRRIFLAVSIAGRHALQTSYFHTKHTQKRKKSHFRTSQIGCVGNQRTFQPLADLVCAAILCSGVFMKLLPDTSVVGVGNAI